MAHGRVSNPGRLPHLRAVMEHIRTIGGTVLEVNNNGHYKLRWSLHGHTITTVMASSPKSNTDCVKAVKQSIKLALRNVA